MNKTKIEWTDYTANPVKGYCPMACPYCYARAMYDRFGWDKVVRFEFFNAFYKGVSITSVHDGSKIFVGSTIELFGEWVKGEWIERVLELVRQYPQHTFQFLAKCPENLAKWNPWPENAWVGATVIGSGFAPAWRNLAFVDAPVKFVSFEPLLSEVSNLDLIGDMDYLRMLKGTDISWIIIGAQTNPYKPPKAEWVQEIIDTADKAEVPTFLKDNLQWPEQRREWPKRG